jgi:hypothetical protein
MLRWLTELADRHGVALLLTPQARPGGLLDQAWLEAWYRRHGFARVEAHKMARPPCPALAADPDVDPDIRPAAALSVDSDDAEAEPKTGGDEPDGDEPAAPGGP